MRNTGIHPDGGFCDEDCEASVGVCDHQLHGGHLSTDLTGIDRVEGNHLVSLFLAGPLEREEGRRVGTRVCDHPTWSAGSLLRIPGCGIDIIELARRAGDQDESEGEKFSSCSLW